jgi:hypothetical protein
MMKETPPTKQTTLVQGVEGEDWIVLHGRTSPMKRLFKHKSPSKMNAGEGHSCQNVGQVGTLLWCVVSIFQFFSTHLLEIHLAFH